MNFLAHALLAQPGDDWIAGAFLGDFLSGSKWRQLPPKLAAGVQLHRRIDAFGDQLAPVREARSLFDPPWRRFAPIALDIFFDHLLSLNWQRFTPLDLSAFAAACYRALDTRWEWLPEPLRRFRNESGRRHALARYGDPDFVAQVLGAISRRIRRPNPLADFWPQLQARQSTLEPLFLDLFEQLLPFAAEEKQRLIDNIESVQVLDSLAPSGE